MVELGHLAGARDAQWIGRPQYAELQPKVRPLLPKDDPWQVMFDALREFPQDFVITREPPPLQEREPIE